MAINPELTDFDLLRKQYEKNRRITKRVIDDFLIAIASRHHNPEKKMNRNFGRYRHVLSLFDNFLG